MQLRVLKHQKLHTYSFERLEVWKITKEFILGIYLLTSTFPGSEKFGLCSQIRRAAISVYSNISEGCSRSSRKEQARFYEIAYGSMMEVIAQLLISNELGFMEFEEYQRLRNDAEKITFMINQLRRAALR